ncbi:CBS domain protein with a domain protein (DUF21) isoform X2 [Wolffia australiana]
MLPANVLGLSNDMHRIGDVRWSHVGPHSRTHVAQPRRSRSSFQGRPAPSSRQPKILPVVKNQHLLLCTLLIGNAVAMEALPIFLDALVPAWAAILISVTLILAFGEIIPQAVCSRYGLRVGAKMSGVVRILLLVFFPIAYPISKILDWVLGKGHFALLRRAELKILVGMHGNEAGKGGELTHDETTIIAGALDMTQKTAKDAMTPISKIFSLDINSRLDMSTMSLIMMKGHSRLPIYSGEPTNIIGLILVKNLITCRPEDEVPVRDVTIRKIPRVADDLPLYDILNEFQKGHSHMAVVVKKTREVSTSVDRTNRTRSDQKRTDGEALCSPKVINVDQVGDNQSQLKKLERPRQQNILADLDSLPSYSPDEEVVGIITMEDVMEELLQEEILDETDEYVYVHNRIRINMLPPRNASPKSPSATTSTPPHRTNPTASPLSIHQHSVSVSSPARVLHTAVDHIHSHHALKISSEEQSECL